MEVPNIISTLKKSVPLTSAGMYASCNPVLLNNLISYVLKSFIPFLYCYCTYMHRVVQISFDRQDLLYELFPIFFTLFSPCLAFALAQRLLLFISSVNRESECWNLLHYVKCKNVLVQLDINRPIELFLYQIQSWERKCPEGWMVFVMCT